MSGKFIVSRRSNGEFQFKLCASNGQTILVSEGYTTRDSCMNGIASVRTNAADATRFEKRTASDGRGYFVLKAGNHQVIGQSQMYAGDEECDNGMESVGHHAPDAVIVEE
ncbi:MAG: YegP family protein [Rhodanobacteraceae bacterium]|nr:YegP family protein [Rhodanobacteraceae bacterium]